ncbi:MAG: S46 family peptidase [Schleiferiaceae bacterium]|nr:S46 family peptidase [Schleiferiaceae bacterium]
MKKFILWSLVLLLAGEAQAHKGMWLPSLLKQVVYDDMRSQGLQLSAENIYSVNHSSLKDAIIHFNGGCTASLISEKGLLLTNHHCGYALIQNHSTLENNYLEEGYWAEKPADELTNPGVTAARVVYLRDVTNQVRDALPDTVALTKAGRPRQEAIRAVLAQVDNPEGYELSIEPFFFGNQFILIAKEQFKDIRLVGAPPSGIGKFGADTDNWMWPRHTGDFSLFRIYAGADNKPAPISDENRPYRPLKHLKINIAGIEPGDFTMVYGFPGSTRAYLPAAEVQNVKTGYNPQRIAIRDRILNILDAKMRQNEAARLQYASKYARISNSWKRWQGEIKGLNRTQAVQRIRDREEAFAQKIAENPALNPYQHVVDKLIVAYEDRVGVNLDHYYYLEIGYYGIEMMRHLLGYRELVSLYERGEDSALAAQAAQKAAALDKFYRDYDPALDEQVAQAVLPLYLDSVRRDPTPELLSEWQQKAAPARRKAIAKMYRKLPLLPGKEWRQRLREKPQKALKDLAQSTAYQLSVSMLRHYINVIRPQRTQKQKAIDRLQARYVEGLQKAFPQKAYFPDGNSTLRVAYGQMKGYAPEDGVYYLPQTHLSGVVAKYQPGDYEFDLPEKLINLYEAKDYGPYGEEGRMPVCFVATNHTTGGNSGSPVLNARGELIGLNFDRAWEGVMSDLFFEEEICRNISVDLRYVLFIVDKFAGAQRLIEELDLVEERPQAAQQRAVGE